jgi:hypothetical protein
MFFKRYKVLFQNEEVLIEIRKNSFPKKFEVELFEYIEFWIRDSNNKKQKAPFILGEILKELKKLRIDIIKIKHSTQYAEAHITKEIPTISFTNLFLEKFENEELHWREIQDVFTHEVTHLYHNLKNPEIFNRLNTTKLSEHKTSDLILNPKKIELYKLRFNINGFFTMLITEGIANYTGKPTYNWVGNYGTLKQATINLSSFFNSSSDYNFKNFSNKIVYDLGEHISHTIMEGAGIDFDEIIKMNLKQLLEVYEEVINKRFHETPLITYSSNKGIIDYKNALSLWHKERKK